MSERIEDRWGLRLCELGICDLVDVADDARHRVDVALDDVTRVVRYVSTGRPILGESGREAPSRIADIRELGPEMEAEMEAELAVQRRRGWIFEEADRMLSIVLPREPPPPSYPNGFFAIDEA